MKTKIWVLLPLMLICSLFFLTGCNPDKENSPPAGPTTLSAPTNLSYQNNTITWDAVSNAATYYVKITTQTTNGVETQPQTQTQTVSSNSCQYIPQDEFSVVVQACPESGSESYLSSSDSYSLVVSRLQQPSDLEVRDGTLTWTEVSGATSYKIFNGTQLVGTTNTNSFAEFNSGESYSVTVVAVAEKNKLDSTPSVERVFEFMHAPTNLQYSLSDNKVTWSAVTDAEGYTVLINDDTHSVSSNTTYYNLPALETGISYTIKVKTNCNRTNVYSSGYSTPIKIRQLGAIDINSLTLTESSEQATKIDFDDVDGVLKYNLKVNGQLKRESSKSEFDFVFEEDTNVLTITTVANPNGSPDAEGILTWYRGGEDVIHTVTKHRIPQNLHLEDNKIKWDQPSVAEKYELEIDGNKKEATENAYTIEVLEAGNHVVKVRALGNGKSTISSSWSADYNVYSLHKVKNISLTGQNLTWDIVDRCSQYIVNINGTETPVSSNTMALDLSPSVSVFDIQITAKGNPVDGVLDATVSDIFTITRLAVPENPTITKEGKVMWDKVTGAEKYEVIIDNMPAPTTDTMFDLIDVISETDRQYSVQLRAVAPMTGNTISSNKTVVLHARRLSKPENIKIENAGIVWDEVDNALQYKIVINTKTEKTVKTCGYEPKITVAGKNVVEIFAEGNDNNDAVSTTYINSATSTFEFDTVQLATPKNLSVKEKQGDEDVFQISWNAVANATKYKVIIGGAEYCVTQETTCDFNKNPGTHMIKVQAIGDECSYVNSLVSNAVEVTVLTVPADLRIEPVNMAGTKLKIRWTDYQQVVGYEIELKKINISTKEEVIDELSDLYDSSKAEIDFSPEEGYQYKLKIKAVGDGESTYSSAWSKVETYIPTK